MRVVLATDTPSRYATGARLTMRAGDAAILRRLAHSGNSGGSGGSAGASGTANQPADAMPLTQQRSQMNVVVVDTVCSPAVVGSLQDNVEHPSRHDVTSTAPYTDNSVL